MQAKSHSFHQSLMCINSLLLLLLFSFVRDNYGFVTFAHYDGACAAVERKFILPIFFFCISV